MSKPHAPPSPKSPTPEPAPHPQPPAPPPQKAPQPPDCGASNCPHIGTANAAFIGIFSDGQHQPAELDALLAAPDRSTWHGRRDHALLTFAAQTGLRVSEITALTIADLHLGTGPHVYCHGKGRKDRCTPLTSHTAGILTAWLGTRRAAATEPLFCTRSGAPMSSDAVTRLIAKHARTAAQACPSTTGKTITPHTLRHTAAMTLLHAGIDITVIALWLGHESPATTRVYLHADMALKERAVARTSPPGTQPGPYQAPDSLLAFLDQL